MVEDYKSLSYGYSQLRLRDLNLMLLTVMAMAKFKRDPLLKER